MHPRKIGKYKDREKTNKNGNNGLNGDKRCIQSTKREEKKTYCYADESLCTVKLHCK
jgi:hypothetical protein